MPSWAHKRTRKGSKQIEEGRRRQSWTSLRPERPGTRPKTTTKQDKKTDRGKPKAKETEQTKQGNPIAKKQETEERNTKRREAMKRKQKGARVLNTGSQPERGRTTRGETGAAGKSYLLTTQYQERGRH